MRAIIALLIAVAFVFVGTSAAAPSGEMKSSPLFKRSLEESIATLEGKAPKTEAAKGQAEAVPTRREGCEAPLTSAGQPTCSETCEPTQCGGSCYTQASTCYPTGCGGTCSGQSTCSSTCAGSYTCTSTCANTCASTCASTCSGTSCSNYCLEGNVKHPGGSTNWNGWVNRKVKVVAASLSPVNFNTVGYYFMPDAGSAPKTIQGTAQHPNGLTASGTKFVPSLGNPGIYQYDIETNYY